MKTSLEHLPAIKQDQLRAITELYRTGAPVAQVILFGSHARGDWVEDRATGYVSDYDLLVVVRDPVATEQDPWVQLEKQAKALAAQVPVNVIVHDLVELNQEIRRGNYFFVDIVREGVVLFDSKQVTLSTPKILTQPERFELAKHHFDYWFDSASVFWHGVGYFMRRGDLREAAFLLHQSAERFFHTVLLVFTLHKPRTHDLERLSNRCASLHPAMRGALPRDDAAQEQLFKKLKQAYIEARYSESYQITLEELSTLRTQVQDLARLSRRACEEELGAICGLERVGHLAAPPEDGALFEVAAHTPDLTDAQAVERWKEELLSAAHARGRAEGLQQGLAEGLQQGEQRGRAEGLAEGLQQGEQRGRAETLASAIVDVLGWRNVSLTEGQRDLILQTRDHALLDRLWERARFARSADELLAEEYPPLDTGR